MARGVHCEPSMMPHAPLARLISRHSTRHRPGRVTAATQPLPTVPSIVNALTVGPAVEPVGRPWLCRAHDVAGASTDRPCCQRSLVVEKYQDRLAWSILRVSAKSPRVRLDIHALIDNPIRCLGILSRHAFASERAWLWGTASRLTVNLRAMPSPR